MGCNSDHLEATGRETQLKRAAVLCVYVAKMTSTTVPPQIAAEAGNYYASDVGQTEWLCAALKRLSHEEEEVVMYDGRSANARDLAEWAEEHALADAKREQAETVSPIQLDLNKPITTRNNLSIRIVHTDPNIVALIGDASFPVVYDLYGRNLNNLGIEIDLINVQLFDTRREYSQGGLAIDVTYDGDQPVSVRKADD